MIGFRKNSFRRNDRSKRDFRSTHTARLAAVLAVATLAGAAHAQFGGWGPTQTSSAVNPRVSVGVGDWDGDGLEDMAYVGSNGSTTDIYIRFGDTTDAFGADEVSFGLISGNSRILNVGQHRRILSSDLDGDGIDDLAFVGLAQTDGVQDGLRALVIYGSQTRSFDAPSHVDLASSGSQPLGSALADVDGDGDLDLMGVNISGGAERVNLVYNLGGR